MDYTFDILQIYRRYCDIMTRVYAPEREGYGADDESHKLRCSREELVQLLQLVESKIDTRFPVLEEVYKLMLRLELNANFSEFSHFYDFVFFICRENGRKNITVSRAVLAWRLILAGRFRLLNQWCNYVEEVPAAFVSFKSRFTAAVVSHLQQGVKPTEWVAEPAPDPQDVYWPFFSASFVKRWICNLTVIFACICITTLFLVPVLLVQGLTHLEQLELWLPFLRGILTI